MYLTPIDDDPRCPDGRTCPAKFLTDRGTAVVQGYMVTDPEALGQLNLPQGETAVEVPLSLLRDTDDERS